MTLAASNVGSAAPASPAERLAIDEEAVTEVIA